mgnify:CR=1 FL=1
MKKNLIIFLIVLLIFGGGVYGFYSYKSSTTKKTTNLNKQIKKLKNTVSDLEKKANDLEKQVSDNDKCSTCNSTCNVTVNNDKGQLITEELSGIDVLYVTDAIKKDNYYTLKGVIYTAYALTDQEVSDMVKNGTYTVNNKTYTVKYNKEDNSYGLYEKKDNYQMYKIVKVGSYYYMELQAQVDNVWKKTKVHKEIVVSSNTPVTIGYDTSSRYKTADDVFKNFKSPTTIPDTTNPPFYYSFKFNFKDGKCVGLYNVITGIPKGTDYPY